MFFFLIFYGLVQESNVPGSRLEALENLRPEALGSRLEALESPTWGLRLQARGSRISDLRP